VTGIALELGRQLVARPARDHRAKIVGHDAAKVSQVDDPGDRDRCGAFGAGAQGKKRIVVTWFTDECVALPVVGSVTSRSGHT